MLSLAPSRLAQVIHRLSSPNVLKFYDWYETRNNVWLILEFCTGGDLLTLIKQVSFRSLLVYQCFFFIRTEIAPPQYVFCSHLSRGVVSFIFFVAYARLYYA